MPTIHLVEIHPIIVHFPIALLIVAVLLDFLALFLRRAHLVEAASWTLGFGTLGILAAELSGQLIEDHVNRAQTAGLLELHKTVALMTVLTFVTLFVVRILWFSPRILAFFSPNLPVAARAANYLKTSWSMLGSYSRPLVTLYLLCSVAGIILLAITGYLGGAMVYDHGVGTPSGLIPIISAMPY